MFCPAVAAIYPRQLEELVLLMKDVMNYFLEIYVGFLSNPELNWEGTYEGGIAENFSQFCI